jgi:uncharacterized protein
MEKKKVLITGGSGLVGSRLTDLLLSKGFEVRWLSRNPGNKGDVKTYKWDIQAQAIDEAAFDGLHAVIHLAGAGVADKRWTEAYKTEIRDSRIQSTQLLFKYLQKFPVPHFIGASAVGYYGSRGDELLTESSTAGDSFLAKVCIEWESEMNRIAETGSRVAMIRIGIVLSTKGGALPVMDKPVRLGVGAYLGDGKQYMPWIHIEDLCGMFIHLLEQESLTGAFNGGAPEPLSNKDFIKSIAKALGRPFIPAPGPAFVLKIVLGEQADMVLMSNRTSAERILSTGFQFQFTDAVTALQDLYKRGI